MDYWGNKQDADLLAELNNKIKSYYDYIDGSGLLNLYTRCVRAYMGGGLGESKVWFESAELTEKATNHKKVTNLKVNQFRSLIKHVIQIVSSEKPSFTCRATNTDAKTLQQTKVGNGILDYYLRERSVYKIIKKCLSKNIIYGEGWVCLEWDVDKGEIVPNEEDSKEILKEGDISFKVFDPMTLIRNPCLRDDANHSWLISREQVNKHLLAARYPDYEKEILGASTSPTERKIDLEPFHMEEENDLVDLYTFYHEKNDLIPEGRMVKFVNSAIITDVKLPYAEIPLYCLKADDIENTTFGYSFAFDLIAPQQLLDIMNSTVATNQAQKASNPVWVQGNVEVELVNGMKFIRTPIKPETLDMSPTSQETLTFRDNILADMQLLSSVSSTIRGNPQASLKSGAALALVTNQSLQYHSMLEGSYNQLVEGIATGIIQYLQTFPTSERIVEIAGKDAFTKVQSFEKEDLTGIKRVTVEAANPLSKSTAGRMQIADTLMERGLITSPEKYLMILETGNLSQLTSGESSELINIKAENEALQDGQTIPVIITDFHSLHIREHKGLLADPVMRQDPAFVERVLAHIKEHINEALNMEPNLAQLLRQEALQAPQPQMGAMPQSQQGGQPPSPMPESDIAAGEAQSAKMPKMPTDPLTGEKFQGDING